MTVAPPPMNPPLEVTTKLTVTESTVKRFAIVEVDQDPGSTNAVIVTLEKNVCEAVQVKEESATAIVAKPTPSQRTTAPGIVHVDGATFWDPVNMKVDPPPPPPPAPAVNTSVQVVPEQAKDVTALPEKSKTVASPLRVPF